MKKANQLTIQELRELKDSTKDMNREELLDLFRFAISDDIGNYIECSTTQLRRIINREIQDRIGQLAYRKFLYNCNDNVQLWDENGISIK